MQVVASYWRLKRDKRQVSNQLTNRRNWEHAVALLVEALSDKPKGRGSIPDEVTEFFDLLNPSSRTMALGSTQPLTEISTKNLPGGKRRPARKANNLTDICEPTV
jgi:hypothetical protein